MSRTRGYRNEPPARKGRGELLFGLALLAVLVVWGAALIAGAR